MNFDARLKELIAIGVSIAANCQPCLQFHATKAKENGASELEVKEAINTGKTVKKGAADRFDDFIATLTGETACKPDDPSECLKMAIDIRTTILVSIGASVATNYQPCLQLLINKAKENGISELEIKKTINVGKTVRKGAAAHMDNFVATMSGESPCCSSNPCECGC